MQVPEPGGALTVAGRQLCVMGKRAAVRSASTPCQLRVTSFASKSRLVDRHPLYVPASAAPHVRASHYGLRLAHYSEQYDHGPKITTTEWQTRSAGDEELTPSKPGSMVGTGQPQGRRRSTRRPGHTVQPETPCGLQGRRGSRHVAAQRLSADGSCLRCGAVARTGTALLSA